MKLVSFCLLTTLALLYAGLAIAETMTYRKWEKAMNDQKYIMAEMAFFDRMNSLLDQMVRQMAMDSRHDPALAQLLKDHNINVVINTVDTPPHDTLNMDAAPAAPAQSPDKPAPALSPSDTTASHP